MGKPDDNNVDAFFENFGDDAWYQPGHYTRNRRGQMKATPVQVELDALDPNDLHQLFDQAISEFLDLSEISSDDEEDADREHLAILADLAGLVTTDQLQGIVRRRRRRTGGHD